MQTLPEITTSGNATLPTDDDASTGLAEQWATAMLQRDYRWTPKRYHARFGEQWGIAERLATGAVWFIDGVDQRRTLLQDEDRHDLVLLGHIA